MFRFEHGDTKGAQMVDKESFKKNTIGPRPNKFGQMAAHLESGSAEGFCPLKAILSVPLCQSVYSWWELLGLCKQKHKEHSVDFLYLKRCVMDV